MDHAGQAVSRLDDVEVEEPIDLFPLSILPASFVVDFFQKLDVVRGHPLGSGGTGGFRETQIIRRS